MCLNWWMWLVFWIALSAILMQSIYNAIRFSIHLYVQYAHVISSCNPKQCNYHIIAYCYYYQYYYYYCYYELMQFLHHITVLQSKVILQLTICFVQNPLISAFVISPPPHLVVFSVIVKRSKIAVVSPAEKTLWVGHTGFNKNNVRFYFVVKWKWKTGFGTFSLGFWKNISNSKCCFYCCIKLS